MTALAVDPKAYYQAATNCFDAASALRDSFLYIFAELSECGSMAGVDENGQEWARSYNTSAYGAVGFFQDVHSTLYAYGSALNDIGFTHAQADATVKGAPQPDRPTDPGMPVFGPFSVPASAGGPGQGIVDKGINIVSHIGIPVPDGDTGKLAKAADAWDRLGTIYQNTNARDKITIAASLFDSVTADDAGYIRDDLKSLASSIDQLLTACTQISQSCIAYKDALTELRDEIKGFLKSLAQDLAIDAAITIGLSLISFGAGAVTAGKALVTVQKWAGKIKDGIIAWRGRKALQIAGIKQEAQDAVVKARKVVTDLRDRLRRKADDTPKPPKKSLKEELDNAQVWTGRNLPTQGGPPNGYLVKRDVQGNITHYSYFDADGVATSRVDVVGKPHMDKATGQYIPTPHVVEIQKNIDPATGRIFARTINDSVRPALPEEIP
ncbi:polymorphic toxin type 24 domain-containing protein [Nocardia asiatica]|uniref:polymorphic toxin type 24 domain-containing protein n=1 Tax=Nocardia asiatica TaxID=209252 RepID=UPI002453ECCE|nr:polymorphic toxin type 24 domain-containing protein [Nocardia asiatica]